MAFNTPFTAVAGTAWKAADWNTYGRDNIAWMATDSPACRVYNNADLTSTNGISLVLSYNSERFDNAAIHSTSSNTSRLTAPPGGGGKYVLGTAFEFAANGTGQREYVLRLNGSTTLARDFRQTTAALAPAATLSTTYALSAADYVETTGFQNSGGNLAVSAISNYSPEFWMTWYRT